MITRFGCAALLSLLWSCSTHAQLTQAREKLQAIVEETQGRVGVAILDLTSRDSLEINGARHFPMQSVFKFPIALAVLNNVDRGLLSLRQRIRINAGDLLPETWSPLKNKYPHGDVEVTLDTLLFYTVALSDNNGCDILLRLLGGTRGVEVYLQSLGISGIAVAATEEEMHGEWNVQYRNWSSPAAMCALFRVFFTGNVLSQGSREFLYRLLVNSPTGPHRLKGLLPAGTVVAHKTGSSGEGANGVAAATNDVGILRFPDGRNVIVVVFLSDSASNEETRDAVIARIARVVWEAYQ